MAVYTPLDYIVALVILVLIIEFSTKVLFKKIALDKNFVIASIPVIVFAISVRVLADAGVYSKSDYWSVTPGIYVLAFAFGFACYSIGYIISKSNYWKIAFAIETPFALYFAFRLFLRLESLKNLAFPLIAAAALTGFVYLAVKYASEKYTPLKKIAKMENFAIIFAHMLDASSSFIGIDYFGFAEEHILPEFFIGMAKTGAVMIPLKLLVVLPALYFLESYAEEKKENKEDGEGEDLYYRIIKFIFFILGIGPGTRNSLLLALA